MPIQRPTFQRPEPPTSDAARVRVAITLGDPNGIGPEVVLKSLDDPDLIPAMTPVVVGSAHVLRVHADVLGYSDLTVPDEIPRDQCVVLDVGKGQDPPVSFGAVTPGAGALAMRAVERAVELCKQGIVHAMATAPISKDAIRQAGYDVPGHTEFIMQRTGHPKTTMMMVAGGLRVGLVTAHIPISQVAEAITQEAILEKVRVVDASLTEDFAIQDASPCSA
jgi:4-hydroxythreonine-4-phosphate dehydrogenase